MANLYITLGGGFDGQHVVIGLDGRTIFEGERVTSSPLTDLASELAAVPASGSSSELTASISSADAKQGSTATCALATGRDRYVVIYVDRSGGSPAIRFAVRDAPFGFG